MHRREFIKTSLAGAALAGLATAPFRAALAADPIKVGVLIPQSGPAGLFGPSSENCANMAAKEINGAGGILGRQVELMFADVGGPPADATRAALKLWKGEKADAFIGMHDSAVRGALTNVFKGQVPYIYTPVYEGGECSPGTYVLGETPNQQLEPVIPWMASEKGAGKWYLIGNDYNWPRDTNAAAKGYISASGGSVVGEEYLPFTADNFDSNLAKIKDTGANAVLITLVGGASVGFNRAFSSFGLSGSVTRLGTLIEENTLMGIGAENSANLFSSAGYFASIDTPAAKAFADAYKAEFGADAALLNSLGESCYEGVKLLKALAEKAGSLDATAMDGAADGVSYDGPRGTATMKDRHVSRDVFLAEADGNRFEVVKTFGNVGPGDNCG
jgi:ABC-type branched-subunit amino acid transport system substrate-binding protein